MEKGELKHESHLFGFAEFEVVDDDRVPELIKRPSM